MRAQIYRRLLVRFANPDNKLSGLLGRHRRWVSGGDLLHRRTECDGYHGGAAL